MRTSSVGTSSPPTLFEGEKDRGLSILKDSISLPFTALLSASDDIIELTKRLEASVLLRTDYDITPLVIQSNAVLNRTKCINMCDE